MCVYPCFPVPDLNLSHLGLKASAQHSEGLWSSVTYSALVLSNFKVISNSSALVTSGS